MTDTSQAMAATIVGAVIGGAAGYLLFTDRGRALRRQIEPALDNFARELSSMRGTARKMAGVASEGWNLLSEAIGEPPAAGRYTAPHQTSPF